MALPPRVLIALGLVAACAAPIARAAEGDDADVLPYLGDGAFIVARVDVGRVDPAALENYIDRGTQAMLAVLPIPANQRPMVAQSAKQSAQTAKQWLADMAAAGGKRLYFVLATDAFAGGGEPVLIVPLEAGADPAAVAEVMRRGPGKPDDVAEIGKAVVLAPSSERERLQQRFEPGAAAAPASQRPALAAAMKAAAGEAPLRIAYVPDEAARAWIEGSLPKLPDALGGGETAVLSRGAKWAAFAVNRPADLAHLTVQAENAEHAKSLHALLTKASAFARQSPLPAPAVADGEDAEAAAKKRAEAMTPRLRGDTLTLSVDPLVVQIAIMTAESRGRGAPAQPAAPARPDDGGL
jgi:hypothetical protein